MSNTNRVPLICTPDNAAKFFDWITTRGGLAHWRSADFSNPGQTWTTPANDAQGQPMQKQHWSMEDKPERIVTDPNEVVVSFDKEVKRFHVAVKRGCGLRFDCTSASSAKIRRAVADAGSDAYYVFDYETQDAVIMAPDHQMTLREWKESQPYAEANTAKGVL